MEKNLDIPKITIKTIELIIISLEFTTNPDMKNYGDFSSRHKIHDVKINCETRPIIKINMKY